MDTLILVNTIVAGGLFAIWQRNNLLNASIKIALMVLFVFNILRMAGKV